MRRIHLLAIAVTILVLVGCGSSDNGGKATTTAGTSPSTGSDGNQSASVAADPSASAEPLAEQTQRLEAAGWSVDEFQGPDPDSGLLDDRSATRGNRELLMFEYESEPDARAFEAEFDDTEHAPGSVRSDLRGRTFYWMRMKDESNVPAHAFEAAVETAEGSG